jgi:hypothetical protein
MVRLWLHSWPLRQPLSPRRDLYALDFGLTTVPGTTWALASGLHQQYSWQELTAIPGPAGFHPDTSAMTPCAPKCWTQLA